MNRDLFDIISFKTSQTITKEYSTSFSAGIRLFDVSIRPKIYAIYGFVRLADEVVDTFDNHDQKALLDELEIEYKNALERSISLNPILNSFQKVVREYNLEELVQSFMSSMRLDLEKKNYHSKEEYENYIYGSADVVGLMCLRVFLNNDVESLIRLESAAKSLGSAFQKVNFLRDIKADTELLGRSYFPNLVGDELCEKSKTEIIRDIQTDFEHSYQGIKQLPKGSRLGVYVAYLYFITLLSKIEKVKPEELLTKRIRISNPRKCLILIYAYFKNKLNLV